MQKLKNNKFLKMGVFSAAMITSLLLTSNVAKADEFATLTDVDLKDSNGDIVQSFERGSLVEGVEENGKIKVEYNFGTYEIDAKKVMKTKVVEKTGTSIGENVLLFAKPNIFSDVLDTLNTKDKPLAMESVTILELSEEEKTNGWEEISLSDGRKGWILEKSLIEAEKEVPVLNTLYSQVDLSKDGVTIPRGEKVTVTEVTSTGFVVAYKYDKMTVSASEVGETKPAPIVKPVIKPSVKSAVVTEQKTESKVVDSQMESKNATSKSSVEQIPISTNATGTAQVLLDYAQTKLGLPYVWGGNGGIDGGYDCSGFVKAVFAQVGINLPRTAATQSEYGTTVAFDSMQPGDLLYFQTYKPGVSHVAIYMGNDQMIQASGDHVQITNIHTKYYVDRYLFSKRVL